MEKPIIQIRNLGKEFKTANGPVRALNDINLDINQGEIFGIIGLSGAGKSTLVRCINYLEEPTSGRVIFEGKNLSAMKEKEKRLARQSMGMIFQQFNLLAQRNVLQNVCFPMEANGVKQKEAKAKAKELLTSVGISEEQHQRYPANLSGGEQQRVAIARALSSGAGIILADEPTGNLDTANGNQVMEILLRLAHEEGRCVIVVTHDMDIAAQADEVWRMKDGALALEA